jgi:hypothetical protein
MTSLKSIVIINEAPKEEQSICVTCGMCCDGTLFFHAHLNPGERGHLPEKIEENTFSKEGKDYFKLPCLYFTEKCTIYDRKRADVCSGYRCQLLMDFAEGKVIRSDAIEIVIRAMDMREVIMKEYRRVAGNNESVTFRQLLMELGNVRKSAPGNEQSDMDFEILQARCNIFVALLTKHIRLASDFDKMMIGEEDKRQKDDKIQTK